jgi:uncharacterized membrane protein YcaP (DUF421 family)
MMTGRAQFLGGLAATLTLVVIHRLVAMSTLRWNGLARLTKSRPAVLVRDGRPDEPAMMRHGISRADLLEALRLENLEDPAQAKTATLEASGKISVVPRDKG